MTVNFHRVNTEDESVPVGNSADRQHLTSADASLDQMGYQQLTLLSTAKSLNVPTGATTAYLKAMFQNVRYRDDGVAPTSSAGNVINVDEGFWYTGDLNSIQFIEDTAGGELNVLYYRPFTGVAYLPISSGLIFWLKADERVFKDAGITNAADGETVEQWNEGISNFAFSQSTGSKKPTYKETELFGRPAIQGDGVDDILVNATQLMSGNEGTIFSACKFNTVPVTSTCLSMSSEATTEKLASFIAVNTFLNPDRISFIHRDGAREQFDGSTTILGDVLHRGVWSSDGSINRMRLNGNEEIVTASVGANTGSWFADVPDVDNTTILAIKSTTENNHLKGELGELLVYDRELTDNEIDHNEKYLLARYS